MLRDQVIFYLKKHKIIYKNYLQKKIIIIKELNHYKNQ